MEASRRKFLKHAALGGIVSSFLPLDGSAGQMRTPGATRLLRIAHITDVHILDQKNAELSFERVIADINALSDKPDLIINTATQ